MQILFSLVLLALISCGGGSGGSGSGSLPGNITPPTACTGPMCDNLKRFQAEVANDRWVQELSWVDYNIKFKYIDPTTGCSNIGSGIFSIKYCYNQGTATPVHVTEVLKGVITTPLVQKDRIKEIVRNAELWTYSTVRIPTKVYVYPESNQWIFVWGSEILVINPSLPLGMNPTYYKNSAGKEYSYANLESTRVQ